MKEPMLMPAGKFRNSCLLWLLLGSLALLFSCNNGTERSALLDKKFREADSTMVAGNNGGSLFLFRRLRPQLHKDNPLLCEYYCEMCQFSFNDRLLGTIYADSAINFFSDVKLIKKYPQVYALAELRKGDSYLYAGKYALALTHYFRCQENMPPGSSFEGELNSKIGSIYFVQANYKSAAKYWSTGYHILDSYKGKMDKRKFFYEKQGDLSNTGYCFELANMPDSAMWYYNAAIAYINAADSLTESPLHRAGALTVVYDNMGGLKLKQGDYKNAEIYLLKSMSSSVPDNDGIHIPPTIKLIDLYLKAGKLDKTGPLFARSRILLDKFYNANLASAEKWNELYASFLFKKNRLLEAYEYQNRYIQLRDSLHSFQNAAGRVDIDRELASLHQEQVLSQLKESDRQTRVYTLGTSVIAVLALVIGFLIYRNLKRTTVYNGQLQTALAEVERTNKNYMRVMRVMAHDIINPLAGMTGIASILLLKKTLSVKVKQEIRLIESSGLHSMQMIKELLQTGLADDKEQTRVEPTDLRILVRDSVELMQYKASEKDQVLIVEDATEPITANVNRENIWRVVNNIIVNAIKFSHQGGVIKISLKKTNKSILFTVTDNGVGIPQQSREHIFEMFTPAKRSGTSGEQPFGLGLSICKKIVEKHNGDIWFEDNPEGGTIFFVELPIAA